MNTPRRDATGATLEVACPGCARTVERGDLVTGQTRTCFFCGTAYPQPPPAVV